MDMCYDGTLVLPSSYAMMDEHEMSYTEGGYYMNHSDCNALRFAIGATAASNYSTIVTLITCYGASGLTGVLAGIPVVGWIAAAYGAASIVRSAGSIASALCTEAVYKKGMDVSLEFSWLNPYINCSARKK